MGYIFFKAAELPCCFFLMFFLLNVVIVFGRVSNKLIFEGLFFPPPLKKSRSVYPSFLFLSQLGSSQATVALPPSSPRTPVGEDERVLRVPPAATWPKDR